MKIYDCFTYLNEDLILGIRFNVLYNHVDYFVVVEGNKTHSGETKKKNFNIEKFSKFKKKIIYFFISEFPSSADRWVLENFQRNYIGTALKKTNIQNTDYVIISDVDEIPNLKNIKRQELNSKDIYTFEQSTFHYKINLLNPKHTPWYGSKLVSYKRFINLTPQLIRSYKCKQYAFWRVDKPRNIKIIKNGGWHFSYLNNINKIQYKIKSFAHSEFSGKKFTNKLKIQNKIAKLQDLFDSNIYLKKKKIDNKYPDYILRNKKKFKNWIL
jgi:beta-1,4-mannosyl-glycoprotein beta-1,4-N-acetylglucosaminyltransferase